jgi:hypothetical protein
MAIKEVLNLVFQGLSNGYERDEEMGRVGGDEMGESGGEDVWSVTNRAVGLVYEFQLLALINAQEIVEYQTLMLLLRLCFHFFPNSSLLHPRFQQISFPNSFIWTKL